MKERFEANLLRIHLGENDRWQGKPLYEAIVAKCQELGIDGAIVYRGIAGFGASTRIRHAHHWMLSGDAPLMVSIVDREERIGKLLPHLDAMVKEGLIAISPVEAIRFFKAEDGRNERVGKEEASGAETRP